MKAADWHWDTLRGWGNSRIIKSSYVWLAVVPVAAKMLDKLTGERFQILGATLDFNIALPFSWTMLFLAAVAFAVGQLIYAVWCPGIVKLFATVGEFKQAHPGRLLLERDFFRMINTKQGAKVTLEYLNRAGRPGNTDSTRDQLYKYVKHEDKRTATTPMVDSVAAYVADCAKDPMAWDDLFTHIRSYWCRDRRAAINASMGFFLLGSLSLAWVVGQNCRFVFKVAFL